MDDFELSFVQAKIAALRRLLELRASGELNGYVEKFSNGYGVHLTAIPNHIGRLNLWLDVLDQDGLTSVELTDKLGPYQNLSLVECGERLLIVWLQPKP